MRRLSLASLDSGAESTVYGEEPSASVNRRNPAAKPSWAGSRRPVSLTVSGRLRLGVPRYHSDGRLVVSAALPGAQRTSSDLTAKSARTSQLPGLFQAFVGGGKAEVGRHLARGYLARGASISGLDDAVGRGGITSPQVPQGVATRDDNTVNVDWTPPGQVGTGAPRLIRTYAMSVVDRQCGRWYVKDIRASTQPMGNPMTWFVSSWVVPRGPRSPRKLTDVHGREG